VFTDLGGRPVNRPRFICVRGCDRAFGQQADIKQRLRHAKFRTVTIPRNKAGVDAWHRRSQLPLHNVGQNRGLACCEVGQLRVR
jgi:hypothetical protein